jgi:hypothetical protein
MAIEIVDFPMKHGGSFHSLLYVYQRVPATVSMANPRSPCSFMDGCGLIRLGEMMKFRWDFSAWEQRKNRWLIIGLSSFFHMDTAIVGISNLFQTHPSRIYTNHAAEALILRTRYGSTITWQKKLGLETAIWPNYNNIIMYIQ